MRNKNRIFIVKKRISVFIGRTIFFTSEKSSYQHFDWLYGFSHFFSLVKKIVLLFCSQHGRHVGKGAKEYLPWRLCLTEEEFLQ